MYSAGPFPDEKARLKMEEDMPAIRIHLGFLNAMFGKLQRRWSVASGVTGRVWCQFSIASVQTHVVWARPSQEKPGHKTAGVGW